MSDLFAMSDPNADAKLAAAAENSVDSLGDLEAPWYRGTGSGLGLGFLRGFAKVADTAGITIGGTAGQSIDRSRELLDTGEAAAESSGNILSAILAGHPQVLAAGVPMRPDTIHTEAQDAVFSTTEESAGNAIDYWTPRANEVGRVGQVLGGLGEVGSELIAGAGSPYAVVATSTGQGGKELIDQGVDAGTAGTAAALEGATSYAGLKVPILGKTLTSRVATGIAGNVVLGSGSREAEKLLLASQGYDAQAERFKTDLPTLTTDALLGALFGVTHHTLSPRIDPRLTPSQADAILTARNAVNFQEDTAPGTASTVNASAAHQSAMEATLEQLAGGKPVDVADVVERHEGAQFEPAGKVEQSAELARMVEENTPEDVRGFTEEAKPAESVQSGTEDRAGDYSVSEGELTDEQLAQFKGLRSDVPADENVGGTVGREPETEGPGNAGRSGAEASGAPLTVFRGSEQPLTAEHFAPEALGHASGHPSSGLGVFFTNDRADAQGYGPHVEESHLDIRNPKIFKVEDFPAFDSLDEAAAFRKKLEAAGHDGIVIDMSHLGGPTQYVAFEHRQVLPATREAAPRAEAPAPRAKPRQTGAPASAQSRPAEPAPATAVKGERPAGRVLDTPEIASLRQLAAEHPDAVVYGGIDADGEQIKSTVAEEYARIQREFEREMEDTKAYEAAITCYLGHGA
jgi:hypothetical protein